MPFNRLKMLFLLFHGIGKTHFHCYFSHARGLLQKKIIQTVSHICGSILDTVYGIYSTKIDTKLTYLAVLLVPAVVGTVVSTVVGTPDNKCSLTAFDLLYNLFILINEGYFYLVKINRTSKTN